MGCDIHIYCEKYNDEKEKWESLSLYKKKEDGGFEPISIYDGRDYELFGLLAGVRGNSHFFSGGCGYIVAPRGIPSDLSQYVQNEWECGKDEDGRQWWHTPTWYSFCELDTYTYLLNDFNKEMKKKNKKIAELNKEIGNLKSANKNDGYDLFYCDYEDEDEDDDYNGIDALVGFMDCIKDVLRAYNIYEPKQEEIRILLWFDS